MFFKIAALKKFAIFPGKHLSWSLVLKHLSWSLVLIKMKGFMPTTLLKRDSNTGVFCGYCKIFLEQSFYKAHLVAASVNSKVCLTKILFGVKFSPKL